MRHYESMAMRLYPHSFTMQARWITAKQIVQKLEPKYIKLLAPTEATAQVDPFCKRVMR